MEKIDYMRLKRDLLSEVGEYGITSLAASMDNADEKHLIKFANKYNMDISKYYKKD
jgi:hypothetical protein